MDTRKPRSLLLLIAIAMPVLASCGEETPPPTVAQPALEFARSAEYGQVEKRRATEAEVRAFVTRLHGGIAPRQLPRQELDGLLERLSTTEDPATRRVLAMQFRNAIHAMPSQEERKDALRRFSQANLMPLGRPAQPDVETTTKF